MPLCSVATILGPSVFRDVIVHVSCAQGRSAHVDAETIILLIMWTAMMIVAAW